MIRITVAVLAGLGLGAAALVALDRWDTSDPPPHALATHELFPNVVLQTHDGREVRFYDDLLKGKTVAINFMYIACDSF